MPTWRQPLAGDSAMLLQAASMGGRQGNVLLVQHRSQPWSSAACVERDIQSFGLALHLKSRLPGERQGRLQCRSEELPFTDDAFRRVVLLHVLETGEEPELAEACRVLASSGELLILGLNPAGLRRRVDSQAGNLPRLHKNAVLRQLHTAGMVADTVAGAGVLGLSSRFVVHQNTWAGMLVPLADLLVIRAQHEDSNPVSPLKVKQYAAGVASTAG